jgi:murein DD-endopeptidase MepM/ murein hydrolase activator NlpD
MKRILTAVLCLSLIQGEAQKPINTRAEEDARVFAPTEYPKGFFQDPLEIPISLAANFGELRADHYHMGLDIRTQQRENLPVLAAAEGYVAHIKVEPFGFGQAIYLRHPNGYSTVYGHLNRFFPALEAYVKEQQYKARSWEVSLDIPPSLFPVKKGQIIAYSGNRGGSQGPHLHFEIRSTESDINLNPFLFGLPIADNTPPVIQRLACYDRNRSVYEQAPRIFPVRKNAAARKGEADGGPAGYHIAGGAGYQAPGAEARDGLVTVPFSRISFAIGAFDTQTGSSNPNCIFEAILFDNDRPVIGFRMDQISYENTRNVNAHIDYKTRADHGPWLQHLSLLPGYPPPSIYHGFTVALPVTGKPGGSAVPYQDGVIDLADGSRHRIRIVVRDAYANTSTLSYEVQYKARAGVPTEQDEEKLPAVEDGVEIRAKHFYPGMLDGLEMGDCAFYIGEKSLYDSVSIVYARFGGAGDLLHGSEISAKHLIGATDIPVAQPILVRIKPLVADTAYNREKVLMVRFTKGPQDVVRPEWQGGWASARFHSFGVFVLVTDTVPPVIVPMGFRDSAILTKASHMAFSVEDNLALSKFRAELDGSWLCFSHDKARAYIYTFDEHCPPGRHVLHVRAEDLAGNVTEQDFNFTR